MVVLGIDPGIERTGIGVVEKKDGKYNLIFSKLITTSSSLKIEDRLELLYNGILDILGNYRIDNASIEELFFQKNQKTIISVSQARGVILLALKKSGIPVFEYTPLQVKQSIVGYGRATKNQIQKMLKIILNDNNEIIQDDVADGVALAITHLNFYKYQEKICMNI